MTHDTDLTHDHDPPGTSTLEVYDADILAAESGLIVCSLQYRVGAFGFFYQGNDDAPGNMGLYDQAMALQWIKDNIRSFHGDGDQITLFGESAGITWYHGHGIMVSIKCQVLSQVLAVSPRTSSLQCQDTLPREQFCSPELSTHPGAT